MSNSTLTVTRLESDMQLLEIQEEWNQLAGRDPLKGWSWLGNWWQLMGKQEFVHARLYILCVRNEQQEIVGLAPWFIEKNPLFGRVVKWLGSGSVCTDYLTLLCDGNQQMAVANAVCDWLYEATTSIRDGWDLLQLDCVSEFDQTMTALTTAFQARHAITHFEPTVNCWRLELPATWDDYLQSLSKTHRKRVRKMLRDYIDTGRVQAGIANESTFDQHFDTLVSLHAKRWKSRGEPGVFDNPHFREFHYQVARDLLRDGQLRLVTLYVDGRALASEYQIAGENTWYCYQSGLEPESIDQQPGNLLLITTIRLALDQGLRSIDFLRGDEPYKAHWRAKPRKNVNIRVMPSRTAAKIRHHIWYAAKEFKGLLGRR